MCHVDNLKSVITLSPLCLQQNHFCCSSWSSSCKSSSKSSSSNNSKQNSSIIIIALSLFFFCRQRRRPAPIYDDAAVFVCCVVVVVVSHCCCCCCTHCCFFIFVDDKKKNISILFPSELKKNQLVLLVGSSPRPKGPAKGPTRSQRLQSECTCVLATKSHLSLNRHLRLRRSSIYYTGRRFFFLIEQSSAPIAARTAKFCTHTVPPLTQTSRTSLFQISNFEQNGGRSNFRKSVNQLFEAPQLPYRSKNCLTSKLNGFREAFILVRFSGFPSRNASKKPPNLTTFWYKTTFLLIATKRLELECPCLYIARQPSSARIF